jgi:Gene product 88
MISLPLINTQQNYDKDFGILQHGNKKLGKKDLIWTWDLPAIETCPGKSNLCANICYADDGFFNFPNVKASLYRNFRFSLTNRFVPCMIKIIRKKSKKVIRLHSSGDFYNIDYQNKWHEIFLACKNTSFYFYTRSWRVKEQYQSLVEIAKLENIQSWWSIDKETGLPEDIPDNIKIAYLITKKENFPDFKSDLIFRDNGREKLSKPIKKIDNVLVRF